MRNNINSKDITTLFIRLSLGIIYLTAGFSKLSPEYLGNIIGPVDLGKVLESNLVHIFMTFTAIYQVIAGALLLSQRYSVLGLVLLFPLALGIFIFTVFAGFAATPLINLFILLLLVYAMYQEKETVQQLLKFNFDAISTSKAFQLYPNKQLPNIALGLIGLTTTLCFLNHPILNVILSLAILLFTINLFQVKNYLFIDKVLIILFFIISMIIINGLFFNQLIEKAYYSVFPLMALGFLLYFIRIIYWKLRTKKSD